MTTASQELVERVAHEVKMIRMGADYTGLSLKTHAWVPMDLLKQIAEVLASLPTAQAADQWEGRQRTEAALVKCAEALNSFIYIIAHRFDGDGTYYWMRDPTHEEAQAAMEANNNASDALSLRAQTQSEANDG